MLSDSAFTSHSYFYRSSLVVLKKKIVILLLSVLLYSCASQVAPTGGAKDEEPPQVVRASPQNLSTRFKASRISITFNEFIQVGDFSSQIFFSPALESNPQFRVHGKTLSI